MPLKDIHWLMEDNRFDSLSWGRQRWFDVVSISIPKNTNDVVGTSIFSGATGRPRSSQVASVVDRAD